RPCPREAPFRRRRGRGGRRSSCCAPYRPTAPDSGAPSADSPRSVASSPWGGPVRSGRAGPCLAAAGGLGGRRKAHREGVGRRAPQFRKNREVVPSGSRKFGPPPWGRRVVGVSARDPGGAALTDRGLVPRPQPPGVRPVIHSAGGGRRRRSGRRGRSGPARTA